MKKILLVSLIAFSMIAAPAVAWEIDIDYVDVDDASIKIITGHADVDYGLGTEAEIVGSGWIDIYGRGDAEDGFLNTEVATTEGDTKIAASQSMGVDGCFYECDPPCDCNEYTYTANAAAEITGTGWIEVESSVHDDEDCFFWWCWDEDDHEQDLKAMGQGDFMAGMDSTLTQAACEVDECGDPIIDVDYHAMGAAGVNVGFMAFGHTDLSADDGENEGNFMANMWFHDEPCDPDCDLCPPC